MVDLQAKSILKINLSLILIMIHLSISKIMGNAYSLILGLGVILFREREMISMPHKMQRKRSKKHKEEIEN